MIEDEFDDDWIKNFENSENKYNIFYKNKQKNISFFYLYVNENNILEHIKKEVVLLDNDSEVKRNKLIGIIKNNEIEKMKKYRLKSILKYNITLEPENINKFLKNQEDNVNYLNSIKYLHDLKIENSIKLLEDINSVYLIYKENNKKIKNTNNSTKKIVIKNNCKKTRYKRV